VLRLSQSTPMRTQDPMSVMLVTMPRVPLGTACGSFMERQRIRVPGTGTVGFMMPPRTEMQASADVGRPEGFLSRPWLRDDAIVDLFQEPCCLKAPVWRTSDSIARCPDQFTGTLFGDAPPERLHVRVRVAQTGPLACPASQSPRLRQNNGRFGQ